MELTRNPRYIDMDKCIGCGVCAEKCPKKVTDPYNMGLIKRKAAYVEYPQAVPLKYAIEEETCIYIQKGKCKACVKFCPTEAIDFDQKPQTATLHVGAVVLAPGYAPFDPSRFDSYQYGTLPNVITSMEMERLLSASGPTGGHLHRMSDKGAVKKLAWFQCVGSRDLNRCDNSYCSSVCCMYAIKEAVIAKEHDEELECAIFFMDMRTHGKDFERYYEKARELGVRFIRSRVHSVIPIPASEQVEVLYAKESGQMVREPYDTIVLSVGLEARREVTELAERLDIELTPGHFAKTDPLAPVATSREGIFACGAFQGPKDIPQSVIDASAAASAAGELLSEGRDTLTRAPEVVPETNVINERPKVGVFVCHCGSNIAGVVDVKAVRDYAQTLPYVTYVTDNLYACSQDTQEAITAIIRKEGLNRVVVAACTPKTHEPLFQETLINAGLNKYLFEMVNIRNQNSWVHRNHPDLSTQKAKDLVRMSVSKVALMQPLKEAELSINQSALVVGGGIAGMTTARSLSAQGYRTHIVEKAERLGGQAHNLMNTADGKPVAPRLDALLDAVHHDERITVHLNSELTHVEGFVGNFTATLKTDNGETDIEHGVAILATGASPYTPTEYSYGKSPRILTSQEMDQKLISSDKMVQNARTAVFIQCVGSRIPERQYCSRVCCTHSVDNALALKERNPDMNVYVLYRDIRTYGEREYLYREAREKGVLFIRFSLDDPPQVRLEGDGVTVRVTDHILQQPVEIGADVLTLATAVTPNTDERLAQFFKVPVNDDGFFAERHAKLGPSEFATDGVFLCGMAHYPKPVDESAVQGRAAAARAVTLLAREKIHTSGEVAETAPMHCSACGVCVEVCPYKAPSFIAADARFNAGKAEINPALCKGCGLCVASCRSGAIHLKGFDNDQIFAQLFSLNEVIGG